jgi:hypothetical protein
MPLSWALVFLPWAGALLLGFLLGRLTGRNKDDY